MTRRPESVDRKYFTDLNWFHLRAAFLVLALITTSSCSAARPDVISSSDVTATSVTTSSPTANLTPSLAQEKYLDSSRQLWSRLITNYLQQPLWTQRDAYDATTVLAVPVVAAFELDEESWQGELAAFFDRELAAYESHRIFDEISGITKLQALYLPSLYLAQNAMAHKPTNPRLLSMVEKELLAVWNAPSADWKGNEFPTMASAIRWKIEHATTTPSYFRSIHDGHLYPMATAANIATVLGSSTPQSIRSILDLSAAALATQATWEPNGGWVWQPGAWTDHRDYSRAGYTEKIRHDDPMPVPGIAEDSSHAMRWPTWLSSFEGGFEAVGRTEDAALARRLQAGLATQMITKVFVPPSTTFANWRTTNYMDGRNGIYRYGYSTDDIGLGVGPYGVSGSFLWGWWSLLHHEAMRSTYCDVASRYPFNAQEQRVYLGTDTNRDRNPIVKSDQPYSNGLTQLLDQLACMLPDIP